MTTEDEDHYSRNQLALVGDLARSKGLPPNLVEAILGPELIAFARSPDAPPDFESLLETGLNEMVEREGIDNATAALYLGMTEPSFREFLRQPGIPLHIHRVGGENRFLKSELDSVADGFLPLFKTWPNRTALLQEFFRNLKARTGFEADPQYCEIESCSRLADVVCANPACRSDDSPRKVCVAHRERLRDRAEKSLCEICVRRVLYGDLQGQFTIGGTEERLKRDHPDVSP